MDLQVLIIWYVAFILFGVIGLPFTSKIFHDWKDKGYVLAKFVGLFLVTMPLWFLASLKIVQFTQLSTWVFFTIALVISCFLLYKKKFTINRQMIFEEVIFLVVLFIWASIRTYNSQIEGTEKFMNLAFMNSIFRSTYFPPADVWYTGGTINYYYLGHYMYTFIAKMLSISTGYVYNLALVTIITQIFVSFISIFLKLFDKGKQAVNYLIAILGSSWICFGGNLHYAFSWLTSVINNTTFVYFFPNPTRIIPFAIDEFPAYSIVLGDVHGHYIVLPFLVLGIAFLMQALKVAIEKQDKLKFNMLISFFIVALYGINSWDFITINFAFLLVHLFQVYKLNDTLQNKAKYLIKAELALIVPGFLFIAPYFLNFKPAVTGIGLVPFDRRSPIGPWLLMWGMFAVATMFYFGFLARGFLHKHVKNYGILMVIVSAALVLGVEVFFFRDIFVESNYDYFRTNTVFKFYYHAWIFWGIASTWFVYAIATFYKKKYRWGIYVSLLVIAILYVGCMSYLYKAVNDFYPFKTQAHVTLEGTTYLEQGQKGDYDAITWINQNIQGQPVMLEAVGEAYTYYARISTHTGLPTVMGWPTHEWQWRGDPKLAFSRADDVKLMYTTTDEKELISLIQKYQVQYVYIGDSERSKYSSPPALNEEIFKRLYQKIYDADNVQIYKVF